MGLDQLRQEYSCCQRCQELLRSRIQVVFGEGNPNAEVLLIGEAPGLNEARNGIPFCGASGEILNSLLAEVGISREDVFITNTILCRPQDNRNPAKEEVENCRERLNQLIKIMDPKVIVTIGNFATERILGKKGITTLRGKVFEVEIDGKMVKVVPVIHPANLLYNGRNPEIFRRMVEDFKTISGVIGEKKIVGNTGGKTGEKKSQKSLGDF